MKQGWKLKSGLLLALCVSSAYADDGTGDKIAQLQKMLEAQQKAMQEQQVQMKAMADELKALQRQKPAAVASQGGLSDESRNQIQEQQWQIQAMSEELKALQQKPAVKASEKGFGIQSADGNFSINLRGQIQTDGRFFSNGRNTTLNNLGTANAYQYNNLPNASGPAAPSPDTFLLKQFRPIISGTVFGIYDYALVPDFGNGATNIQDAYVDARFADWLQVKIGKQKSPFALERLQGDGDGKFAERGLTSNMGPNRDIGIQLHGSVLDGRLDYSAGYFDGVPDGSSTDKYANSDTDNNRDKDFLLRVFAKPFKNDSGFLKGLGFGLAGTYSNLQGNGSTNNTSSSDTALGVSDTNLSGYKTDLGQQTFFSYYNLANHQITDGITAGDKYATYANGERFRWSPQFYYYAGPFGLMGEYVGETQEVSKYADGYAPVASGSAYPSSVHANKTTLYSTKLHNDAWQMIASWVLTGEDAGYSNPKPKRNFDLNSGGWGAWELVGRYSRLNIDNDAFSALRTSNAGFAAGSLINAAGLPTSGNSYADPRISARSAQAWAAGVNWYPNNLIKIFLDYEHTSFDGGYTLDGVHVVDRPSEDVVLGRVQLAF